MSADKPPAEPKPAAPPSGKTSKAVLALLLLNLGASGFGTFKAVTAEGGGAAKEAPKVEAAPKNEVSGPVVAFDPFVVNLDEPGQSRYIKITLQVELVTTEAEHGLEQNKQLIRDTILSHLSGLKLADTLGAAAKDKLRTELLTKISAILGPTKVRRLFFQEFVVQ